MDWFKFKNKQREPTWTNPGKGFQFTETPPFPGLSNHTIIQTTVTSVTDTTSVFIIGFSLFVKCRSSWWISATADQLQTEFGDNQNPGAYI